MSICQHCGFDWGGSASALQTSLRSAHSRFRSALEAFTDAEIRRRPAPDAWSALEYGAHVRDVVAFYKERILRTLKEDCPRLSSPDWSVETDARQYNREPVEDVLKGIGVAAEALADLLLTLRDDDWSRQAVGSTGEPRDVLRFARGATHETEHHCKDAELSIENVRSV